MNREILHGDVLEKLKEIPDESIDCIITSPPYWGLRDYGVEGQLGLEPSFKDFLKVMKKVMDECKRVLKKTGSCWINLGDTYAGSGKGSGGVGAKESFTFDSKPKIHEEIQSKSRIGIPERFYIECIDNGWIARNFIPWIKGNAMPSSVNDNLTNKWESVFFFVKNNKPVFWYNELTFESIPEQPKTNKGGIDWIYKPCTTCAKEGLDKDHKKCNGNGIFRYSNWHARDYFFNLNKIREETITPIKSKVKKVVGTQAKLDNTETEEKEHKQDKVLGADGKPKSNYSGFNERYNNKAQERKNAGSNETLKKDHSGCYDSKGNCLNNPNGKNPGNVFFINTQPYKESHFATFPPKLPEKILKCACPDEVCNECGIPRYPVTQPTDEYQKIKDLPFLKKEKGYDGLKLGGGMRAGVGVPRVTAEYVVTGYSKCNCDKGFSPGIVLDIFLGAGTVGLAAEKLGLQWMGIELNQKYIDITRKRLDVYKNDRIGDFVD